MKVTQTDLVKAIINAYSAMGGLVWVYENTDSALVKAELDSEIKQLEYTISILERIRNEQCEEESQ